MNHPDFFNTPRIRQAALLVLLLGFALRLYRLGAESLWYDELLQLDIAQGSLTALAAELRVHTAVPLDYLLAHGWIMLGRSESWVRLPAALLGTLTLPLAYRLGRSLLGPTIGLLLLLLLALSPFHIYYSQEARPYALLLLGVCLTVYSLWQYRYTGHRRYLLPLQLGVLLLTLAHIFGAALLLSLFLFLAIEPLPAHLLANQRPPHSPWQPALKTAGGLLLTLLLPLLVFIQMNWLDVLFYSGLTYGEALLSPAGASLADAAPAAPPEIVITPAFVQANLLEPLAGVVSLPALTLLCGLTLLGGIITVWQTWRVGLLLWLWLLLPPLLIIPFLQFRETFFAARYILSTLPAFLLFLAMGVAAGPLGLARAGRRRLGGGLLALLLAVVLIPQLLRLNILYRQMDKENWRLVAATIAQNSGPNDAIIAVNAEQALNWYYPPAAVPPGTFDTLPAIAERAAAHPRSWVILSIFSTEQDARIKAWLSEQQAVRLALDPLIHVYYLGHNTPRSQLLAEIQQFSLPIDHTLYASLARENRRQPAVARRYWELALQHAPDEATRAQYRAALQTLR